jgi:hypothetical protein
MNAEKQTHWGVIGMTTRRRFSKEHYREKLATREGLQETLYLAIESVLQTDGPNIRLPALRAASELGAIIVSQIVCQTEAVQRAFKTIEEDIPDLGSDFVAGLVQAATGQVSLRLRRNQASSVTASLPLADDWAGPVAGPTEIERFYGIPRSTLYRWQKLNEVVAIRSRTSSKPVFPLRQFLDGRPVDGLAAVIAIYRDQRTAWKWLIDPNSDFDGKSPLDMLLIGETQLVVNAALTREEP